MLRFRDDLSCGPINSGEPAARAAWWKQFYEGRDSEAEFAGFWGQALNGRDRMVVWFGRHDARELAFFLLGPIGWRAAVRNHRRYRTAISLYGQGRSRRLSRPTQATGIIPSEGLRSMLGSERAVTAAERDKNAPTFGGGCGAKTGIPRRDRRGLASAPADVFDLLILAQATVVWQREIRLIAETMGNNMSPTSRPAT